jgi:hypothetical protein
MASEEDHELYDKIKYKLDNYYIGAKELFKKLADFDRKINARFEQYGIY